MKLSKSLNLKKTSLMQIEPTARFKREFRRLAKKFPSLIQELRQLEQNLLEDPTLGTSVGMSCYKIRIAIASKGVGKRGGARLITYVQLIDERIHLLSIYDKSEQDNIADKDLLSIIKEIDAR